MYMGIAECSVFMTDHKDQSLPVMKQINTKIMRVGITIDHKDQSLPVMKQINPRIMRFGIKKFF